MVKVLCETHSVNNKYRLTSEATREFNALWATAIDADRFPILAKHWPGAVIIDHKLYCNDASPLARRFPTMEASND